MAGLGALAWWLVRRPRRTLSVLATVTAEYASVPRVLPRALATVLLATAHARTLRVDHVHAHFATYPALAAWVAWRLTGTPYSFTAHAHDLFIHQAMLARKAADAEFVVAISEYNRRFLLGRGAATVHVVHCGVDPERFPFRPRTPRTPPRVVCVATLKQQKGHAVLLRALAAARRRSARPRGRRPGARARSRREAARLGVAVRFHGNLPEPAVADVLAAADVFVLPSVIAPDGDMEGIPVALMEALAAGLPVVATRQSGVPELDPRRRDRVPRRARRRRRAARRAPARARRAAGASPPRAARSSSASSISAAPPAAWSSCSATAQVHPAGLPVDRHLAAQQHGDRATRRGSARRAPACGRART